MDEPDNVVDLWRQGHLPTRAASGNQLWPTIRDVAIFPAFRICAAELDAQSMSSAISLVETSPRPFTALWWQGRGHLSAYQVGVMFTYGGDGRLAFEVTGALDGATSRLQSQWHREFFSYDERGLSARVLSRAALGMGMLLAMSSGGRMPALEVRHIARRAMMS